MGDMGRLRRSDERLPLNMGDMGRLRRSGERLRLNTGPLRRGHLPLNAGDARWFLNMGDMGRLVLRRTGGGFFGLGAGEGDLPGHRGTASCLLCHVCHHFILEGLIPDVFRRVRRHSLNTCFAMGSSDVSQRSHICAVTSEEYPHPWSRMLLTQDTNVSNSSVSLGIPTSIAKSSAIIFPI